MPRRGFPVKRIAHELGITVGSVPRAVDRPFRELYKLLAANPARFFETFVAVDRLWTTGHPNGDDDTFTDAQVSFVLAIEPAEVPHYLIPALIKLYKLWRADPIETLETWLPLMWDVENERKARAEKRLAEQARAPIPAIPF